MALVKNRKGIGGRKPVVIPNPFIVYDVWGDETNILWGTEDELDIRIEDMLVGCVRAFRVDKQKGMIQEYIDWHKLLRLYRESESFTRQGIQDYLMCSQSQAKRYIRIIKFTNLFVVRFMANKGGSKIRAYVDVTVNQVNDGYTLYPRKRNK